MTTTRGFLIMTLSMLTLLVFEIMGWAGRCCRG